MTTCALGPTGLALVALLSAVAFTAVDRGTNSGIAQPLEVVIQSGDEWRALWSRHASGPPVPQVDFASEVVVGVFAGQRPTAGYEVQIRRIERGDTAITVVYEVRAPAKDAMAAQVITSPFDLVRFPRQGLPIRFARR